jgi:hypothetical protein
LTIFPRQDCPADPRIGCTKSSKHIKFLVKIGDNEFDKIISYNQLSHIVEAQEEMQSETLHDAIWSFHGISSQKGSLALTHSDYKGSSYHILIQWDEGSKTMEPLDTIIKNHPVTVSLYATEHNLLDTLGWEWLIHIALNRKPVNHMTNQHQVILQPTTQSHLVSHYKTINKGPDYNFGFPIPRNAKDAFDLDQANGSTLI